MLSPREKAQNDSVSNVTSCHFSSPFLGLSPSLPLPSLTLYQHTQDNSSPMAATITGFSSLFTPISPPPSLPASPLLNSPPCLSRFQNVSPFPALSTSRRRRIPMIPACSSIGDGDESFEASDDDEIRETLMLSVSPLPLLLVASLPGGITHKALIFIPTCAYFSLVICSLFP